MTPMESLIEGLKLTAEGMTAAFVVCLLLMGLSRAARWPFRRDGPAATAARKEDDQSAERAAAIAAAVSFVLDEEPETAPGRPAAARAWDRKTEEDLPEGGTL